MDEPVTEAPAISLYFIARLLREHVTVALSGEGADELFAGYDIYRYMRWIETYRRLPEGVRLRFLEPILTRIGSAKITKYMYLARKPLEERYLGAMMHDTRYKNSLYTREFRAALDDSPSVNPLAQHYTKTRE